MEAAIYLATNTYIYRYIYIFFFFLIVEYRNKLNMFGNCRDQQVWLASVVVYLCR